MLERVHIKLLHFTAFTDYAVTDSQPTFIIDGPGVMLVIILNIENNATTSMTGAELCSFDSLLKDTVLIYDSVIRSNYQLNSSYKTSLQNVNLITNGDFGRLPRDVGILLDRSNSIQWALLALQCYVLADIF